MIDSEKVACFFCGGLMTLHEEPLFKSLRCRCGEGVFVDYHSCSEGYPTFGPTCLLAPALKHWTEEIALEWEKFEAYKISAYLQMGYYSAEEAKGHLAKIHTTVIEWRNRHRQRHRGLWATVCRLFHSRESRTK